MNDFLIITNSDMSLQSGNVALINRRAEEIYIQKGIKTVCVVINKKVDKDELHNNAGINYLVLRNVSDIADLAKKLRPQKIVFYGIKTYSYIPLLKKKLKKTFNYEIYIDIQGAVEETIEYANGFNICISYCRFVLQYALLFLAINLSDGAFVVSDELESYSKAKLLKLDKDTFKVKKIRCGISKMMEISERIRWRSSIRKEWGINENAVVMAFSGYRMPWQKTDEIIQKFKEYDSKLVDVFFVFFCNSDNDFENKLKSEFPRKNYLIKFLSVDEYFNYLSACDVGFLLRDYNITNMVAFPNKFSDYLNAGLMVAINPALPEPCRLLKEYNIDYIDLEVNIDKNCLNISKRQNDIMYYYRSIEKLCRHELLYSTQIKKIKF